MGDGPTHPGVAAAPNGCAGAHVAASAAVIWALASGCTFWEVGMGMRFNTPPGWPPAPPGFAPAPGWKPDPAWPPAPTGWNFWIPDTEEPAHANAVPLPDPSADQRTPAVPAVVNATANGATTAVVGEQHTTWRERHAGKKASKELAHEHEAWAAQQQLADDLAQLARTAVAGGTPLDGLLLRKAELGVASFPAALIEPRVAPGHYSGGYSGVSVHIAKGVNYRVGGSRGHYVPGPEVQTPIDRGMAYVTSQRVVFTGGKATREWVYDKLVGTDASSDDHTVLLHVSNRQKVSGLALGSFGALFQAVMELALAINTDGPDAAAGRWSTAADEHRAQEPR